MIEKIMNRSCQLLVLFAAWICFLNAVIADDELPVRVMSFNIRYGTAKDGNNHWDNRKDFLVETIQEFDPDLLGTQETLAFQRNFIQDQLSKYQSFGVGRDDGQENGEMAALFFSHSRFEKLDGGHFWLSPTPEIVGSKGWDAALPRIATWVKLHDKSDADSRPILFLNTHFDHMGGVARSQSARLIRDKVTALGFGCRIIVTGDFNAGTNSGPYQSLFESDASKPEWISLHDTFVKTPSPQPDALAGTFSNFKAENTGGPRIDWIACSSHWQVRQAGIDRTQKDGRTPSDHFPVTAVLRKVDPKPTLRVLSYNIHHGRGMDGQVDLKRIAGIIRKTDPDVVALQEVDRNTTRTGKVDQASELGRLTGMFSIFAKAIDFEGGEYGQAMLSRFPLNDVETTRLVNRGNREQRIAVSALFDFGKGNRVQFISTHLDHTDSTIRFEQASQLANLTSRDAVLTVLAGDINDTPQSKVLDKLAETWSVPERQTLLTTFPAPSPTRQIDHVFLRGPTPITRASMRVIEEPIASDHRPIFLQIEAATWQGH
jgi:endonuclease/exonuclease/phosphatase family metal-dependent hydrolase